MKLELGAGTRPRPGFIHHDRWQHSPQIDVVWDLDVLPWPWADGSVHELLALDVMEHLRLDVDVWLREIWRILVPGGYAGLRLPAWDNHNAWRDPTHRRVYADDTLAFFDPAHALWQTYGRIYWPDGPWFTVVQTKRVNPPPTGPGDLQFLLRKRDRP